MNNLRWNQFSGQLGGPVLIPKLYNGRDKTFFFFSGEPRYQSNKQLQSSFVPTDAMRSGDFSNLGQIKGISMLAPLSLYNQFPSAFMSNSPVHIYNQFTQLPNNQFVITPLASGARYSPFSNDTIPQTMLDPVAVKLLKYVPRANTAPFLNSNGYLNNYVTYQTLNDDSLRFNTRIDQNFGDLNHMSFRWTRVPAVGVTVDDPNYPTNGNSGTYSVSSQYTISDTQTFSPTVVNELRLAYTRANFSGQLSPQFDVKSGENLSTEYGLPSLTKGGLPLINIYDLGTSPANIGNQPSTLGYSLEQQYEIADNVYVTRGGMTWKFGVDLSRALLNTESLYSLAGGNYDFRYLQTDNTGAPGSVSSNGGSAFASFLLGVPDSIVLGSSDIPYYYRWNSGA
ncbi:MAG: hypothetical protein JOZ62_20235, partial [Acidobacteriaceae bacterium]|nr:hypothetical protein [Acidobacteriaceae bacterium]